jgi:hypothetical protein
MSGSTMLTLKSFDTSTKSWKSIWSLFVKLLSHQRFPFWSRHHPALTLSRISNASLMQILRGMWIRQILFSIGRASASGMRCGWMRFCAQFYSIATVRGRGGNPEWLRKQRKDWMMAIELPRNMNTLLAVLLFLSRIDIKTWSVYVGFCLSLFTIPFFRAKSIETVFRERSMQAGWYLDDRISFLSTIDLMNLIVPVNRNSNLRPIRSKSYMLLIFHWFILLRIWRVGVHLVEGYDFEQNCLICKNS